MDLITLCDLLFDFAYLHPCKNPLKFRFSDGFFAQNNIWLCTFNFFYYLCRDIRGAEFN